MKAKELSKINYENSKKIIERNFINNHVSFIFEDVCEEFLWDINLPFQPLKIGIWWDNNEKIDLIGINALENSTIFGECKFGDNKVGINVLNKLKEKCKKVKSLKADRKEYFILFSKVGFTEDVIKAEEVGDVILYSLDN